MLKAHEHDYPLAAVGPLQLSPIAQWVTLHGPKSPVLDVSTPPGVVCETLVERDSELVCVNPHAAIAEALSDQFGHRVQVKSGQIANLPLASHSMGSVIAVSPDLEGTSLDAALDEFARVLQDDGLLIVAPEFDPGIEPWREAREFRDLQEAVLRRLDHSALVRLSHWVVATVSQASLPPGIVDPTPREAARSDAGWASANGTVVVASNRPLPSIQDSFVVLSPPEVGHWVGDWHRVLGSLQAAEARAASASKQAEERDLLLEELLNAEQRLAEAYDAEQRLSDTQEAEQRLMKAYDASTIRERESLSRLQETDKQIALLNDRITTLEEAANAANARIQELQTSTSWRVTEPVRRLRDRVGRQTRR